MPKWEVCEIVSPVEVGWHRYVHQAVLYGPSGSVPIAQSSQYSVKLAPYDPEHVNPLHALIAQLAMDGWEPIPLAYGDFRSIIWLFKRPLSDS